MREKLKEYALIAEVISSIAVLTTLIVFLYQVKEGNEQARESNQLVRANTYQTILSSFSDWRTNIYSNDKLMSLYQQHYSGSYKPNPETGYDGKLVLMLINFWSIYDGAFIANEAGLLGANE